MKPDRATYRRSTICLIVMAVLFLGLVQWSFLPLLIDGEGPGSSAVLSISAGHTSKFAAPFKCWVGDSLNPCLVPSTVSVPLVAVSFFRRVEEHLSSRDGRYFSFRQYRAPPSA